MSNVGNRPYIGTLSLDNKEVVRLTPDAMVFVNGDLSIPGCPDCNGKIDLQPYISQVSVDPATAPPATASVSLHIPRAQAHSFFRDGQCILRPGLEINIYFRGYFPVEGLPGGEELAHVVTYPYYHAFHGVVTEVSTEYSGGTHTVSMSCSDLTHFWQFQRMSTSGSYFGARPVADKNKFTLTGHNFVGMTPYSIIYTLWKDVMGAAGGIGFALDRKTNVASNSSVTGQSIWSMAMLYWEKRFSERMGQLRMYGVNGQLYNSVQQAFLSRLTTDQAQYLRPTRIAEGSVQSNTGKGMERLDRVAAAIGFASESIRIVQEDEKKTSAEISITQQQAFVTDVSMWGECNFWESQYETKMEIINAVTQLTNFEFYMDVDGDFVFKPPFYNLDTSSSRIYVIKPIDIINFTSKEGEPEATAIKATGSWGRNMQGLGLDGPWGKKADYIDYRLVAQFGWRQQTMETEYTSNTRAMFYICMNRMDLFNLGMNSANCTIPLRPELRPGYPVYIEHLDCFYYLTSFNHSFSFGGQCTTTLNLVGKRAKFYAPGKPPLDREPEIRDIDLGNPLLPKLPLQVKGWDGIKRLQGFPNVVMALDPTLVNPLAYVSGGVLDFSLDSDTAIRALIQMVRSGTSGVLSTSQASTGTEAGDVDAKTAYFEGPFVLIDGPDGGKDIPLSIAKLKAEYSSISSAHREIAAIHADTKTKGDAKKKKLQDAQKQLASAEQSAEELNKLMTLVQQPLQAYFPEAGSSAAYLNLLGDVKAGFTSASVPGYYRYYSCSHPDPQHQGMSVDLGKVTTEGIQPQLSRSTETVGWDNNSQFGKIDNSTIKSGINLMMPGTDSAEVVPTNKILRLSFALTEYGSDQSKTTASFVGVPVFASNELITAMTSHINEVLQRKPPEATDTVGEVFSAIYKEKTDALESLGGASTYGVKVPTLAEFLAVTAVQVKTSAAKGGELTSKELEDAGLAETTLMKTTEDPIGEPPMTNAKGLAQAIAIKLSNLASDVMTAREYAVVGRHGEFNKAALSSETLTDLESLKTVWKNLTLALAKTEVKVGEAVNAKGTRPDAKTVKVHTPVFPVSDERGYEVIGSYYYGRGLSISPGGSFEQLFDSENPADFSDLNAVVAEAFIDALVAKGDVSGALGTLDNDKKVALAEAAGIDPSVLSTPEGATAVEASLRGHAANSGQATQHLSVSNAAFSLADLQVGTNKKSCACNGVEADILLHAFGEAHYVSVNQSDELTSILQEGMAAAAVPWKAQQDLMRGSVLDRRSFGVADAFESARASFRSISGAPGEDGVLTRQLAADAQSLADGLQVISEEVQDLFTPDVENT